MKILIVEDDKNIGELLEALLKIQNHEVHRAISGSQALQKSLTDEFDFLICDLMLPDLQGTGESSAPLRHTITAFAAFLVLSALDPRDWEQACF
ncbi:MAG: response regulator [Myxococcota bacterium]